MFLKELLKKIDFEKKNSQQPTKKHENYPACKELNAVLYVDFLFCAIYLFVSEKMHLEVLVCTRYIIIRIIYKIKKNPFTLV